MLTPVTIFTDKKGKADYEIGHVDKNDAKQITHTHWIPMDFETMKAVQNSKKKVQLILTSFLR